MSHSFLKIRFASAPVIGVVFLFLLTAASARADTLTNGLFGGTQVSISFKDTKIPANDLYDHGQLDTPENAWDHQQDPRTPTDLSTLDPDPTTDLWKDASTASDNRKDEALPIQSGDEVTLYSSVTAIEGVFKLSVQAVSNQVPVPLTLMMSTDIHTYLLRKEILRRLGYQIQPMKYLPRVSVRFPDAATRDSYLQSLIPLATNATATRWCRIAPSVLELLQKNLDASIPAKNSAAKGTSRYLYPCTADPSITATDPLLITFIDVLAMDATPLYPNVALGPPLEIIPNTRLIRAEAARILRALAVIYGLVNVPESVNQLDWYVGRVQDGKFVFQTPFPANYSCTLADAAWILRRIQKMTREDFNQIVENAFYPAPVAKVLVEKLIARRNSLYQAFGIQVPTLSVNPKNGKILQQEWPGYASRFAHGDLPSPLKGLGWYALSELETNAIEFLINKANEQLPALTAPGQNSNRLQKALTTYLETGIPHAAPVMVAPIVNGGFAINREVVFGSYMGTNNLVQLADTLGFNLNAGVMVAANYTPACVGVQGLIQGSLALNLTHIKPLNSLKQGFTAPRWELMIPWLTKRSSGILSTLAADTKKGGDPRQLDATALKALRDKLSGDLDQLKKFLDTGDSLVLTLNLTATQKISGGFQTPLPVSPSLQLEADSNQLVISRIHLFRKDTDTIQIFQDDGDIANAKLSLEFSVDQPVALTIFNLDGKGSRGRTKTRIFTLDLNPDPIANPQLFASATALASVLRTGSLNTLESFAKPTVLNVKFRDKSTSLQAVHLMRRTLKQSGDYVVQLPDKPADRYLYLTDGKQTGKNYQLLATQAASYLIQKLALGAMGSASGVTVDTQASNDPGRTFLGKSMTRESSFQSRFDSGISEPSVSVQRRWEGWKISAPDLIQQVHSLNKTYGFTLFDDQFLGDAQSIQLYELTLSTTIYDSGIAKILSLSSEDEQALERRYESIHHCNALVKFVDLLGADIRHCGDIIRFKNAFEKYRKGETNPARIGDDIFRIVDSLEKFAEFPDLVRMAGGPENLYVAAQLSGFRSGSELASTPLASHSFGHASPYNPNGVLNSAASILGIDDGEFYSQWARDFL